MQSLEENGQVLQKVLPGRCPTNCNDPLRSRGRSILLPLKHGKCHELTHGVVQLCRGIGGPAEVLSWFTTVRPGVGGDHKSSTKIHCTYTSVYPPDAHTTEKRDAGTKQTRAVQQ
ncbi:hypothetical protein Mapa_013590 [Marchantia paleacea]|nr:hypothetical protein Mapa_013590 [Marchantia paleacea]